MNQKRIERMIPKALALLAEPNCALLKNGEMHSTYPGYLAAFGPAVVQNGIVKTLAFYLKASGEAERNIVLDFIKAVFLSEPPMAQIDGERSILEIYIALTNGKPAHERLKIKSMILEAAIACKLAASTYKKAKEEKNER